VATAWRSGNVKERIGV